MTADRVQAVANARADVGYREGNGNLNKYTPAQTFGRYNYQPYCASATSMWWWWAGLKWNISEFPGADASCVFGEFGDWNVGAQRQWGARQGLLRSPSNYRAQPGDLIIESFGIPDQHVELCWQDTGGNIATIGANTGNGVWFRSRSRWQCTHIVAVTLSHQVGAPEPAPIPIPVLEENDMLLVESAHPQNHPPMFISGPKGMLLKEPDTLNKLRANDKIVHLPGIGDRDYARFLKAFKVMR